MREYTTYTISDLVEAIQNNYTTEQEDYIIAGLIDYVSASGTLLTSSGTSTTYSGAYNDGTWYYDYTVTSGSAEDVAAWRLANYASTYRQAYRSIDYTVFKDDYTTVSGRTDMELYDRLCNEDTDSYLPLPASGVDTYLKVEYPRDLRATSVRVSVSGSCTAYFGYSMNDVDYTYLGSASHTVVSGTRELTAYTTASGANINYVNLAAGENNFNLPSGVRMRYGKAFFIDPVNVIDYEWHSIPRYLSRDGRTIHSGNTYKVFDSLNAIKVRIGDISG